MIHIVCVIDTVCSIPTGSMIHTVCMTPTGCMIHTECTIHTGSRIHAGLECIRAVESTAGV